MVTLQFAAGGRTEIARKKLRRGKKGRVVVEACSGGSSAQFASREGCVLAGT